MIATKISLAAGIIHALFSLFYLFVGFRLTSLYQELPVKPNPILSNWPLITFLAFSVLNFLFWYFLRSKEKQQLKVAYGLPVSIILLIAPFVIFYASGIYADIQVARTLKEIP